MAPQRSAWSTGELATGQRPVPAKPSLCRVRVGRRPRGAGAPPPAAKLSTSTSRTCSAGHRWLLRVSQVGRFTCHPKPAPSRRWGWAEGGEHNSLGGGRDEPVGCSARGACVQQSVLRPPSLCLAVTLLSPSFPLPERNLIWVPFLMLFQTPVSSALAANGALLGRGEGRASLSLLLLPTAHSSPFAVSSGRAASEQVCGQAAPGPKLQRSACSSVCVSDTRTRTPKALSTSST